MKVLLAASEVVPFAKVGGLADVSGALPPVLSKLGVEVQVIMPYYRAQVNKVVKGKLSREETVEVMDVKQKVKVDILSTTFPGSRIKVLLVDYPPYFDRQEVYNYPDELERYLLFSKVIYELLKKQKFDLLHCNDWHTALVPALIKTQKQVKTPVLLTIHNLQYQGVYPLEQYSFTGLSPEYAYPMAALEFYGKMNLLKGGIIFADKVSTVSPTYAREIKTSEFGENLEGVLTEKGEIEGILNGVDLKTWNPALDELIPQKYDLHSLEKKESNKHALLKEFKLAYKKEEPLLGIISRLADQKGFDLLIRIFDQLMKLPLKLVILGTGQPEYHTAFARKQAKFAEKFGLALTFNNQIAHLIEAGADLFLMPSRFEPCGLNQMYSLKYGNIPVVRETGGLADTIIDVDKNPIAGNGFSFKEYSADLLLDAVKRGIDYYGRKEAWRALQVRAMTADVSWEASARKYLKLYQELIKKPVKSKTLELCRV